MSQPKQTTGNLNTISFNKFNYRRQNWPFQNSFINYIIKNPSNPKTWEKLIQCCKHFFTQNPILVVERFYFDMKEKAFLNTFKNSVDVANLSGKLWITEKIDILPTTSYNLLSLIVPQIYQADIKFLRIFHQIISFNEFLFLSSNVEEIILCNNITLKYENGTFVQLEQIVKSLPKIKKFYLNMIMSSYVNKNTINELLKVPHFSKINCFTLFHVPETFNIDQFLKYIKKNNYTKFALTYDVSISEAFRDRLEEIIDEIIETKNFNYKIPFISYMEIAHDKWIKMCLTFDQN